jgi:lysophospholipase L1-like esterase
MNLLLPAALACLLISGLAAAEPAADPSAGPPAKDKPTVPGWGFYPQWPAGWMQQHQANLARTAQGGIDVVFTGDSLVNLWSRDGKAAWDEHFAPLKAVNYGIGADSTRQVLWRIAHGELDGIAPKAVVVEVGTNNLYQDHNAGSDDEIVAGIDAVVKAIRAKAPRARVLVLGLLPRQNEYFCTRISAINAGLARLDDGAAVRVLDCAASFVSAPGQVKADLFQKDLIHPNATGYALWAQAIAPLLTGMVQ